MTDTSKRSNDNDPTRDETAAEDEQPDRNGADGPDASGAATPEEQAGSGGGDDGADTASANTGDGTDEAADGRDPEAEIADLKDRLMRAVAETENLRRRSEREKQETAAYSITTFARDLLAVSDNLRRALEALPEDLAADEKIKAFVEGVQMTERELLSAFEKHGIRKIVPEGEKFDHNYHQAMFEVEDAEATPGTVVQVVQPGYVIKDRLLRPAMVGVAKAPSEQASKGVDTTV